APAHARTKTVMRIRLRSLACAALFVMPACAVRLSDRNSPLENGGVTGPPADCSKVTPEPGGSYGGEAAPKFVGRFVAVQGPSADEPVYYVFDWSGNYITVRFQGTDRITIKLAITGDPPQDQMFE